jgi:hypothetical protein
VLIRTTGRENNGRPETVALGAASVALSPGIVPDPEVERFLSANPDLIPVIEDITHELPMYFGPDYRVSLEMLLDPEDGQDGELFAVIHTATASDDALKRLQAFDSGWWFEHARRAGGRITVTLE